MMNRGSFSLLLCLLLVGFISCNSSSNESKKQEKLITTFYKEYINESERFPYDEKKVNQILTKYCTPELVTQLSNPDQDYDPFVNAQDHDPECLKTMKIKHDEIREELYHLSFNSYGRPVSITLELIEDGDDYRISSVY